MMNDTASDFVVPRDLVLPSELTGESPRDLPDSVAAGPLSEARRRTFWGCLFGAVVCFLLSLLPFVKTLAIYVLPLGYLSWISVALCVGAAVEYFRAGELKAAANYIRNGHAAFGRVVELIKCPTIVVNGQPTMHAFQAFVQVINPQTDLPVLVQVKSRDFRTDIKDQVRTRFRVGDCVPKVWLPNRFDETLQIYDFLELTPEASLQRVESPQQMSLWQIIALVVFIPVFIFALFWNIYAMGRFSPLEFDYLRAGAAPFCIGGLLALLATILFWLAARRKRREIEQRNVASSATGDAIEIPYQAGAIRSFLFAIVIVAGAVLLGGLTFLCWCFTANALLDQSPRHAEAVQITDMIQVTHSFLFREFKLKFRRAGRDRDDSMLTTPDHLSQFDVPLGNAQIRSGWLGWQWVETIEPLAAQPPGGD
jgi:hypothetical protein